MSPIFAMHLQILFIISVVDLGGLYLVHTVNGFAFGFDTCILHDQFQGLVSRKYKKSFGLRKIWMVVLGPTGLFDVLLNSKVSRVASVSSGTERVS